MKRALLLLVVAIAPGCEGLIGIPRVEGPLTSIGPGGNGAIGMPPQPLDSANVNADIYARLKPACISCHKGTDAKPFFETLNHFETLVVYAEGGGLPLYVVGGSPQDSELLRLLLGTGTGPNKQMPQQGETFATLATQGKTLVTIAQIEEWITHLPAKSVMPGPTVPASAVRRKTAEQIATTLKSHLGLTDADFFSAGDYPRQLRAELDAYALRSPDAVEKSPDSATGYFGSLGGPDWLNQKPRNQAISANFSQAYIAVSQSWCRKGAQKSSNPAFYVAATPSDTLANNRGAIEKNIEALYLAWLGEPASAAERDDLVALYADFESAGAVTAWAAVCSAMVRDPLWLTY
jgi:hypothetical protein